MLRKQSFYGFDEIQHFKSGHISIVPWWMIKLFAEDAGFIVDEIQFARNMDKKGIKVFLIRMLSLFKTSSEEMNTISLVMGLSP